MYTHKRSNTKSSDCHTVFWAERETGFPKCLNTSIFAFNSILINFFAATTTNTVKNLFIHHIRFEFIFTTTTSAFNYLYIYFYNIEINGFFVVFNT